MVAPNLDILLQKLIFDFWAIPCTFLPYASQPSLASYAGRGILGTYEIDVEALDGSIFSDQRTIFDVRESEFAVALLQGDHIVIPYDCNGVPKGEYEILDVDNNGGGQLCCTIRVWEGASGITTFQQQRVVRQRRPRESRW